MRKEIDLTGKRFGNLYILGRDKTKEKRWLCRCDVDLCGKIISKHVSNIRQSHRNSSCGCLKSFNLAEGLAQKTVAEAKIICLKYNLTLITDRMDVEKAIFTSKNGYYKYICNICNITFGEKIKLDSVLQGQHKSCGCNRVESIRLQKIKPPLHKSNVQATNDLKRSARLRNLKFDLNIDQISLIIRDDCFWCGASPIIKNNKFLTIRNQVDRVDNNIGYVWGNCVPACKKCNTLKINHPLDVWIHITNVYKYRRPNYDLCIKYGLSFSIIESINRKWE